jgi:acyl-CoA thioesterase
MDLLADFQVKEPSFMVYSAPSTRPYPAAEDCPSTAEHKEALLSSGKSNAKHAEIYETAFRLMESYFEIRRCVDGIASQNWNGIAKHTVTTQDHLPITSKTTAEWYRLRQNPGTEPQQMAALAFIMDAALSFIPLTHDHKFLDDVGACSSLDFALRVFVNADEVDLQNWALIERQTSVANAGRTYSENRCWDADGRMIASMTQQSIMRVKPGSRASL